MAKVFQYGSNMQIGRLNAANRLDGSATLIGVVHTVQKFDFDFTIWSKTNNCAAADIILGGEHNIWGALYEIPDERVFRDLAKEHQLRSLDQIEGEGYNYERIKIDLSDSSEERISGDVYTYIAKLSKRRFDLCTSKEYSDHILKGLFELEASADYVDYIRSRIGNRICH